MSRHQWTPEQTATLIARYPSEPTQELADELGVSLKRAYAKAAQLGLKKAAEYLSSPAACRLRSGDNKGASTRFKRGGVVWNKGMKGLQIGGVETRFKAGMVPHNTRPIGSHKLDKDGTLLRKVSDVKGNNSKRWRSVHELVWIEVNGPLPAKHMVVFKPGMRTNRLAEITIDRVECISRGENMKRNTVHNLPKELAELVQLRGALLRKINHRTKHHEQ